jgi:hypothetical protein
MIESRLLEMKLNVPKSDCYNNICSLRDVSHITVEQNTIRSSAQTFDKAMS